MRPFLSALTLSPLLVSILPSIACATTIVYTPNSYEYASGVDGLVVDGTTYDVSFIYGSYFASPFLNQRSAAYDATAALVHAFNDSTVLYVVPSNSTLLEAAFGVVYDTTGQEVATFNTNLTSPGHWGDLGYGYGPTHAVFTPVTSTPVSSTPEPSTFALLGTGLVGASGAARRRFKRQ